MNETQKTVTEWADETFGAITKNVKAAARANEEMAELLKALAADDNHPKMGEEIADIFIVLMRLAETNGYNLQTEINKKMNINRNRQWKLDGAGHGYHTK